MRYLSELKFLHTQIAKVKIKRKKYQLMMSMDLGFWKFKKFF